MHQLLTNRRRLAGAMSAMLAGLAMRQASAAQESTPQPDATPAPDPSFGQEFLFVQTFAGGSFASNASAGTPVAVNIAGTPTTIDGPGYTVRLSGHNGQTVYFSDRPARIFGEAPTATLFENLGFTPVDPPNAALVTTAESGDQIVVIVELINPQLDESSGEVVYDVNLLSEYSGEGLAHILDQEHTSELPAEFGASSLFIDGCSNIQLTCMRYDPQTCEVIDYVIANRCWNWKAFACEPCNAAASCNNALADCQGRCQGYTDEQLENSDIVC